MRENIRKNINLGVKTNKLAVVGAAAIILLALISIFAILYPVDPNAKPLPGVPACLLITADKGLAGAYNQNAIRQAQQLLPAQGPTVAGVIGSANAGAGSASGGSPSRRAFTTRRRTLRWTGRGTSRSCCWNGSTRERSARYGSSIPT